VQCCYHELTHKGASCSCCVTQLWVVGL